MPDTRRQATLFLSNATQIEHFRRRFSPYQARLISAHVTLCREDEVENWVVIRARLDALPREVTLEFGPPRRDGDLVYLPGNDINGDFRVLRSFLLAGQSDQVRDHAPHITLIHPRNGKCTDEIWTEIETEIKPFVYTFSEASIILQSNGGVWETLQSFPLAKQSIGD